MSACEIIRYKISRDPFEPRKDAVKCLTHGWTAYEGQMGGVIDDECPIARAERLEGVTDAARTAAVTAFVEGQPDRWAETLEEVAKTTMALRAEITDLLARVDAIAVKLIKLGAKP